MLHISLCIYRLTKDLTSWAEFISDTDKLGKEFAGKHVIPGALGTQGRGHVAERRGGPFISRVAVGVRKAGFLLQGAESRGRGAREEAIHLRLTATGGDDHFLWLVFDADILLVLLADNNAEGGTVVLLIAAVALQVAALLTAHLLHWLGVDVVEVDQFIKGLQLN